MTTIEPGGGLSNTLAEAHFGLIGLEMCAIK